MKKTLYGNIEQTEPEVIADDSDTSVVLTEQAIIGEEEIRKAASILAEYKNGKANLENRVVEDELWWQGRHWEAVRSRNRNKDESPKVTSEWLFNAILNKHADAMDNYPEPIVLPRERSDENSAKVLSSILPVVLENNDFGNVYSENWWEKLKHGTAVYGVFWNPEKENGLGDIDIKSIDLLKIFWEPGITDIQKSQNLFIVELVDKDVLKEQYPDKENLDGNAIDVTQYIYDDTIDNSNKTVVVDWYYKVRNQSGKTVLHYCKFVGETLLYASENDEYYRERGFYDHALYPVVFDTLYPEKSTPVGFGYVAICKEPQLYIDALSTNILETSMQGTKKRFFASESTNVNVEEFMDWNKPIVRVAGEIDDRRLKEFTVNPLDSIYVQVLQLKIEEMKDTAANRDINSGGKSAGITAASAIAALQEAGNKASRDMISASYRSMNSITRFCIELMRQFYDEMRSFRITGTNGEYEFVDFSNADIGNQPNGIDSMGNELYRMPIFDLKIKAQKTNPFSRMEQNERAKELYAMGFFNPDKAQESLVALDMMEFEGIDKIREQVSQGQTLMNIIQQMQMQMAQLMQMVGGMAAPTDPNAPTPPPSEPDAPSGGQQSAPGGGGGMASQIMQAQTPMTSYGQRLAKRSTPDMNATNNAASPV